MQQAKRGILLTIFAVLFALAAIQDVLKPFHLEGAKTGLVVLGTRLSGTVNLVMSLVLGLFLLIYAIGVWRMNKYALPLSFIYAIHVLINVVVFPIRYSEEDNGPVVLLILFTMLAIAIPWAAALILWRHRAELA